MKKGILLMLSLTLILMSCGGSKTKEGGASEDITKSKDAIELKSFMLGGMYFYNGFGGVSAVESMLTEKSDKEKMIAQYKEIFVLPFKSEQAADIKSVLSNMWEINNKSDLEASMKSLMSEDSNKPKHKAWDYARIVNNASMGYAAGFLTADEAKKYAADALVAAQKNFKNWDDYLKDYNAGRNNWDPEAEDKADFDKVTSDMMASPDGLYKTLPLN